MPELSTVQNGQRYYYANGEKIPITPSNRFVAVKGGSTAGAKLEAASLSQSFSGFSTPLHVFDLPNFNLSVIEISGTPGAATPAINMASSAEAVRSVITASPSLANGPTVYEPSNGQTEALIPVGEILVRFKAGVSEDARRKLLNKYGLEQQTADYPEPGTFLVVVKDDRDPIDAANALHEEDQVEYAQPNFARLMTRLDSVTEDNISTLQYFSTENPAFITDQQAQGSAPVAPAPLRSVSDPNFSSQWNLQKVRAPEAWDISMGSSSISIAVIDEGCDLTHEDLSYKLPGYDAVTRTDNPTPNRTDGHGTSCSGIVAMVADNGRGGAGIAPNCKILPVRIAYGIGGGYWATTDAQIADGIRTAVNRGADVLSNSWGSSASTVVTNAFNYAQTNGRGGRGCPIAAATGNSDVRGVIYPANLSPSIPGFMAVGASNEWDQRKSRTSLDGENWWGSNYGPEVDVVAPGVHIFTSDIMGSGGYSSGNYVSGFNGTSSATPHVAGLMGLILSVDPGLRSWEVEDIIKLTAVDLGPAGRDEEFGFGRIDARRALEAASRLWYEISVTPEFIGSGRECFMRINLRLYNPGINTVRVDGFNLSSYNPSWSTEVDRFEYRPNPGNVLAPRSGNDVRFNRLLLRANGNASNWSYRWSLNWWYTFWRPGAPSFPLDASAPQMGAEAVQINATPVRGGADMPGRNGKSTQSGQFVELPSNQGMLIENANASNGDSIMVDRQSKTITIVVR